ncbi:MAG: DmsC/YnfH family molybdoenzyme membrane anchor subunit [Pseudomonadota bacterium]
MHPAYSVIFFTTASGAGYGLLIWMAFGVLVGIVPPDAWFGFFGLALSALLIVFGLLSSMLHLGRPERAWRAFSQWQTSWLSREGVASVVTFVPMGIFGIGWVFLEDASGIFALCAILSVVGALVTVWCTGMIYASLSTIKAWHHPLVAPVYCALALMSGCILFNVLVTVWFGKEAELIWLGLILVLAAWLMKVVYWSQIDTEPKTATAGDATGLAEFGTVKVLEPAHTQPNFVMREMGFAIGRKHADKLRLVATMGLFVVPAVCLLMLLVAGPSAAVLVGLITIISVVIGVLTERWLFFAEAKHIVMLYYGAEAV